jgi:hypothetical protein
MPVNTQMASMINKAAHKVANAYEIVRDNVTASNAVVFIDANDGKTVYTNDKSLATKLASKSLDVKTIGERMAEGLWVYVKKADITLADAAKPVAQVMNLAPASWNKPLGGLGTSPLVSMLTSGLLGGGLGYAGGALAERLIPQDYMERNKLRKSTAYLGALLGAAGPAYLGYAGMRVNEGEGKNPWSAWVEPNVLLKGAEENLRKELGDSEIVKQALEPTDSGLFNIKPIPVDSFNRAVLTDPYASLGLQTATVGLVEAANQSRGNSGLINPYDIARIGMGMGAGLTQAYLGGRVLGALAGLTPKSQQLLQQTGMYAGALKAVVPGLFGQ